MTKFLCLWRRNKLAPYPTDPAETAKMMESMMEGWRAAAKSWKDWGFFISERQTQEGDAGYLIVEGTSADMFRLSIMFSPWYELVSHEIIPGEFGMDTLLETFRMQAAAAKQK